MRSDNRPVLRRPGALVCALLCASVLLGACEQPEDATTAPPLIEVEGGADQSSLTFHWRAVQRGDEIERVSLVVHKDGEVLDSIETDEIAGAYSMSRYTEGTFSITVEATTVSGLQSAKTVSVETVGNLPSLCPSRPVWMPPESAVWNEEPSRYPQADLIQRSSLIVAGTATDIQFCQSSPRSIPFTFVTFSELRVIHGTHTQAQLTLAFAGGVMNGRVHDFIPMPKFGAGARYVLFLTGRAEYRMTPTVGWTDGVLLSDGDGIRTYQGHPIIGISHKDQRLFVAARTGPERAPIDPAYGAHRVVAGGQSIMRSGPSNGHVAKLDVAGREPEPVSEDQFAEAVRLLVRKLGIATPGEGRLLKPGARFELPPIAGAPPGEASVAGGARSEDQHPQPEGPSRFQAPLASLFRATGAADCGFFYTECCGDVMKWQANVATMKRLPESIPTGSVWADALIATEQAWSGMIGASFRFNDAMDDDNWVEHGADGNEVAFVSPDDIDRYPGVTHLSYMECDCDRTGPNIRILEADVMFSSRPVLPTGRVSDWNPGPPDPRALPRVTTELLFAPIALHELGHALGLSPGLDAHEDGSIATMNSAYPAGGWYPGPGSERVIPHGDDRAGVRFIYPGGWPVETDIAVLNFWYDLEWRMADLVRPPTPERVCPGRDITVEYNFGNVGSNAVTFDLGFYLSTDVDITPSDILLASERWDSGLGLGSYGPGVLRRTLTIPSSVSFDTEYFVGVVADYGSAITEYREGNNTVAVPGSIHIPTQAACEGGELLVAKVLAPPGNMGQFNLQIDGVTRAAGVGHNGTTGWQAVGAGQHTVGETPAAGTDMDEYESVVGGDCGPDGSVTLGQGDSKVCTITNTHISGMREMLEQMCENVRVRCLENASSPGFPTAARCIQMYNQCLDAIP